MIIQIKNTDVDEYVEFTMVNIFTISEFKIRYNNNSNENNFDIEIIYESGERSHFSVIRNSTKIVLFDNDGKSSNLENDPRIIEKELAKCMIMDRFGAPASEYS